MYVPSLLGKNVIFNFAGYFGLMLIFMSIVFSCPLVSLYNPVFDGPQAGETHYIKESCGYLHKWVKGMVVMGLFVGI